MRTVSCALVALLTLATLPINCSAQEYSQLVNLYIDIMQVRIKSKWIPPSNFTGKTIVRYKVLKNGVVKDVRVHQGSQKPDLDKACITAVNSAGPFPTIPADLEAMDCEFSFDKNIVGEPEAKLQVDYSAKVARYKRLLSLRDNLAKLSAPTSDLTPEDRMKTLEKVGSLHYELGEYAKAEKALTDALKIASTDDGKRLGRELPISLTLANVYYACGRFQDAESTASAAEKAQEVSGKSQMSTDEIALLQVKAKALYKLNRTTDANQVYALLKKIQLPQNSTAGQ